MHQIGIGIPVHTAPRQLQATLDSLRAHTPPGYALLLLPDGPDAGMGAFLQSLPLPQAGTAVARGDAACFNRLVTTLDADLYVLLESGAQVGPGWLEALLAALDADPCHGLAGPSTNRAWNEQGVFPRAGSAPAQVAHTAAQAARRFGAAWQPLAPLHSLGDFCYAVRREVVRAVGAADEAYGLGPCWEMDYSVRAARAGFVGVWAGAAYVHRAPPTPRRRRLEAAHFAASKRLYQDRFCGLRLRGERGGGEYEAHCRGDACEHFAPPGLVRVRLPLEAVGSGGVGERGGGGAGEQGSGGAAVSAAVAASPPIAAAETPLISCIMPTSLARLDYVRQAIAYFRRQTYANLELIVVDDGPEPIAPHLPADDRIRTLRLPPGQSIGAKRNRACEAARGSIIAHWDDDDWYAPRRLAAQAAPLLSGAADVCGLAGSLFFDLPGWAFWAVTPALHQRLFVGNVHGGTLVYRRAVWQELAQFPNRSLAEDAAFLQRATRRGARLHRLPNDGLFLYLRHGDNSWAFTCGQHVDPGGWQRIVEPPFLAADRAFYAARRGNGAPDAAGPLVSCIMPTADRRAFVPRAIACFLRQEYAHRELIILDDGVESVADLVPADARIRYERLPRRLRVGEKRNLACEAARGDVIAHWDDDDWYASWRLGYQAAQLQAAGADVCGLDRVLYWDAAAERAWLYVYPPRGRPWVAGNTLCYPRAFWQRNPFQAIDVGEDARFVWSQQAQRVLPLPDHRFCVAWIHAGNVSPKRPSGSRWQPAAAAEVHALLGGDTTHGLARREIAAASFRRAGL